MAHVLDAVLETTKALSHAPVKKIAPTETKLQAEAETRQAKDEAAQVQTEAEARPSVPTETEPAAPEEKTAEQITSEKIETYAPKAKSIDYIIHHASRKEISQEEMLEA
jgi:hypothetical protein